MKECAQCQQCFNDDQTICPSDGSALQYTLPGSTQISDKYRLEKLLARGSMGSVYRSQQEELLRPVAIKVLNPQLLSSNVARERFRREALAVASLKHPNIVTVYDFAANQHGLFYIAMELLEGQTLADLLAVQPRIDVVEAVNIALAVCDALAQAHARGIIHRDLKPSNIFLSETTGGLTTKVIDFGLVKLKERADAFKSITAGGLIGSLHYSAPEQCRSSDVDNRADIYSLGAILYHMISGQRPFDSNNKAQLIYQQLNASPLPLHRVIFDVSPLIEAAVMKALEKEPNLRFQSITEFATALKQAPKRSNRRTVGMFLNPLKEANEASEREFTQATQRALCFEHFIARKRERAKLRIAFEQASEGKPTALLISGEPGIGRSSLLKQSVSELSAAGALCFSGQFTSVATAPWAITNIKKYLQQMFVTDAAKFEKIFDSLAGAVKEAITERVANQVPTAALFQARDENRADRALELLAQIYVRLSDQQPVVIALDDLHNADEANLNFLMYLIGAAPHSRLLFLFSASAPEIARPESTVAHWLDRMASQRQLQRLTLAPLSNLDVRSLIEKIFEQIDISDEAIAKLCQVAEGNPFYLTNMLRVMIENGQIYWEGEQWLCGQWQDLKLPPTVSRLLEARLNFLSPQSCQTLAQATILGETFSFEALKRFSGLDEDELMRVIDDGLRYALLNEASPPANGSAKDDYYNFAQHALYQVLYDRWSASERPALHKRAAQLFAEVESKESHQRAEAARQFMLAGQYSDAFCQQVDAANTAWRSGEIGAARQALQQARNTAEQVDGLKLLTSTNGDVESAAVALASHFCDYLMLSVELKLCQAPAQAEEWLEQALLLAQRLGDAVLVARTLVAAGHYYQQQGDYPRALNYFERALDRYQEMGNKQRYNIIAEQIAALKIKVKPHQPTADIL